MSRKAWCVVALVGVMLPAPVIAQAPPTGQYVWELGSLYPTQQHWEQDRLALIAAIERLKTLSGRVDDSAGDLADVMDAMRATRGLAGKMARYGLLMSNIDNASDLNRERYDAGTALEAQVEAIAMPLETDIRALGEARVEQWRKAEPRLRSFGHTRRLRRIFHEARYAAPLSAQPLLASMERWPRTTADTYESLVAGGIPWATVVDQSGSPTILTPNNYRNVRRSPSAEVRDAAAKAFHASLDRFEPTLGLLFARRIEAETAMAKARGLGDGMAATLMLRDAVSPEAIAHALRTVRGNATVTRRYAALLARANRLPQASYGEALARSPWAFTGAYTVPQAIDLITRSQGHLGDDHSAAVREIFRKPWFHLEPGPHKTGGWGVFIQVGGGNPYAFSSFTGNLDSVRLLSSMTQSMLLDADIPADGWPDRREEDQPVFGNSRWNLGPFLVDDLLLRDAREPQQRAAALLDHINLLWTQFFYRGALIELERWAAAAVERGAPPTGAQVSAKYLELMREISGHGQGGLVIPDHYAREWVTEGTLFLGQHQMGWLASHAATVATAEALERRDPRIVGTMRRVRGRNLEYSNDFLDAMGIDLASAAPYDAVIQRMTRKMTQLDQELSAMGL